MARKEGPDREPADRVLLIRRVFDAPREMVFKAWTEPERMLKWWGPKDFTATSAEADLRPGGKWRVDMHSPDGQEYPSGGVYREIVEPQRLVFTFAWLDEPRHETLVTITFADRGGKTELTFRQSVFKSVEERDGHQGGWNEAFDRLGRYVENAGARP